MPANAPRPNHKALARTAGAIYLIVVLTGVFGLMYVPSRLFVRDDATATVRNLVEHTDLFRLGIAAGFLGYIAFLLLPLALHRLLGAVSSRAAALMVAFATASVPISLFNLTHKLDVLSLLGDAAYLRAFSVEQRDAMVMLSLDAYNNGIAVAMLFWGLWLLPFGYLVYKSGFLPRTLGILLMLGCFGYLIQLFGDTLFANYAQSALSGVVTLPATLGEIGICFWLLIVGTKNAVIEPTIADSPKA
ncbi:MAG: DUF4386 domain-containing protein [Xanthomonadaceae bacterium]|nr:DUF4386 domain-containing protein [Xanthomonadaceae bacterium]